MLNISKLKPKSTNFLTELRARDASKSALFSFMLAKTLVANLTVPTTDVEDLDSYYLTQVKLEVMNDLYEINELVPLDKELVADYVFRLYQVKYHMSVGTCYGYVREGNAVTDLFGISKYIDPVILEEVENNHVLVSQYSLALPDIIQEMIS